MEVRGCLGGVQWGGRVMGEGLSLISVAHVMMFVLFALLSNHQYCINTFEAYMFYTSHALVEKTNVFFSLSDQLGPGLRDV